MGTWKKIRNVFIIFLVSGFWHGANWTFIFGGLLNALYILPSVLLKQNRSNLDIVAQGRVFPTFKELFAMVATFALTVFAWIFFRSDSLASAFHFIKKIFSRSFFSKIPKTEYLKASFVLPLLAFFIIEWMGREEHYAIANLDIKWPRAFRVASYYILFFYILYYVSGEPQQFIMLILLSFELFLRKINTSYTIKKDQVISRAKDAELLILGNSHSARLDPGDFSLNAFNLAQVNQSLYFDKRITLKYIDRLKKLKYVLIGVDFHSLYFSDEGNRNLWSYYAYGQTRTSLS